MLLDKLPLPVRVLITSRRRSPCFARLVTWHTQSKSHTAQHKLPRCTQRAFPAEASDAPRQLPWTPAPQHGAAPHAHLQRSPRCQLRQAAQQTVQLSDKGASEVIAAPVAAAAAAAHVVAVIVILDYGGGAAAVCTVPAPAVTAAAPSPAAAVVRERAAQHGACQGIQGSGCAQLQLSPFEPATLQMFIWKQASTQSWAQLPHEFFGRRRSDRAHAFRPFPYLKQCYRLARN